MASWPEWGHGPPEAECQEHADCTAGPSGRCRWQGAGDCGCGCDECITDADRAPGRTCMCGEDPVITGWVVHTRVPAECRGPADCPEGESCVVARIGDDGFEGFPPSHNSPSCTLPADRCRSHEACACTGAGDVCSSDGQALGCREIQPITCA